jgi:hypothetical protein
MAGFLVSLESSPSPERMKFCGDFLSEWNFLGILFGRFLARIAEYLLNGSPRELKFHNSAPTFPIQCLIKNNIMILRKGQRIKKGGAHSNNTSLKKYHI